MDFRNNSIKIEKITSMDVNTAIQRSTAKAVAMHGLGLSLWVGEDITSVEKLSNKTTTTPGTYTLKTDGDDWVKVLKYIEANKKLGLEQIVKNLQTKYKVTAPVKKQIKAIIDG